MGRPRDVDTYTNDGEPSMRPVKNVKNVKRSNRDGRPQPYKGKDFPVNAAHPDHPDLYRMPMSQFKMLYEPDEDAPHPCDECLDVQVRCDRTCGFGNVWVGPVTRLRIRMMENQT